MTAAPHTAKGTHPAVFLDRDGVIVVPEFRNGRSYAPKTLDDFHIYPEAEACVQALKDAGYRVVVVTNQPDVGNGLTDRRVVEKMHDQLANTLSIDRIETCYCTQHSGCASRKPEPGMLITAARALDIDLSASVMIGDRASDIKAGQQVGCRTVFIDLGYTNDPKPTGQTWTVKTLTEAVEALLHGTPADTAAYAI